MTTERELAEWSRKIRRVRGQAPLPTRRRQAYSPWLTILLFLGGVAIAVMVSNQLQQPDQPRQQPPTYHL